ncbi:MAG: thiamine diphosphokinase [Tannerellaceae bacterium]|jgi:thiamine pyrophosphokinase|nr:thiamine diphosphokinase [Tannerellaceae bacterium]
MIQHYDCVIAANGSFPTSPLALELLRKASVIIACDGAAGTLHQNGFVADAIIGDLDSIPASMRELYADRIHIDKDQETNDLTKAVMFARQSGERNVLIIGATGLREDHTLGNISLLADYAPLFDRIEMLTDFGLFTPIRETTTLGCKPGQQISIFSLYPEGEITTEGLRWPITNRRLTAWWQGTLNEALTDTCTIHTGKEARVIVYRLLLNGER